jgi:hypothetical protein
MRLLMPLWRRLLLVPYCDLAAMWCFAMHNSSLGFPMRTM